MCRLTEGGQGREAPGDLVLWVFLAWVALAALVLVVGVTVTEGMAL